jgi:hypothetical protein
MATVSLATFLVGLAILSILYAADWYLKERQATLLPPGPKGLPIIGNVNDLPKPGILVCHHWLQHKDIYGPISSVTGVVVFAVFLHGFFMSKLGHRARSNFYHHQ